MKGPALLCALVVAAMWGPAFKPKPPRTDVMVCFNLLGFLKCYDVAPEPCPPPPKPIPLIPCHEPTTPSASRVGGR